MADRDKFSLFDADGDGCITIAELPLVLYAHGCNPTVKEAEALAARCPDPNRIDFNTFASILGQTQMQTETSAIGATLSSALSDLSMAGTVPRSGVRSLARGTTGL